MQIDWLLVTAQIVNFLVLIYLLKRFLYGPVIAAMERRERRIRERLDQADRREQQANLTQHRYQEQCQALAMQRAALINQAEQDAAEQRQRLLDQARQEIGQTRQRWHQELAREQEDFLRDLRQHTALAVAETARRVLADLADTALEARIVEAFLGRLQTLDKTARQALAQAAGEVQVVTSFAPDAALRARLREALSERLALPPAELPLTFHQDSELIAGIELSVGGQTLSWTVANYLDGLTETTVQTLQALSEQQRRTPQAA